jgi:hypothetical protein
MRATEVQSQEIPQQFLLLGGDGVVFWAVAALKPTARSVRNLSKIIFHECLNVRHNLLLTTEKVKRRACAE